MGEKEEMKEMFQELTGFEKKNISLGSMGYRPVLCRSYRRIQCVNTSPI